MATSAPNFSACMRARPDSACPEMPVTSAPTVTLPSPNGEGDDFGNRVESTGDLNGDGYADVVVGDNVAFNGAGRAYVYYGTADGLSSSPAVVLSGTGLAELGHSVDGAGDVNGDGYGDLIVSAPNSGEIYLYLGGAAGLAPSPATTIDCPPNGVGCGMASAGHVNGDGYADMIVGVDVLGGDSVGQAYIYLGGRGRSCNFTCS